MRGQYRRGDKKYRSVGPGTRKEQMRMKNKHSEIDQHVHHSQDEGITTDRSRQLHDMYDDYPPSYRDRAMNDITSPILEEGIDPPLYGNLYPHQREDSITSETTPSQYFFPVDSGRLPMSAPINRRQMARDRDSSSSCSSFSPNDGVKTNSARKMPEKFQAVDLRNDKTTFTKNDDKTDRASPSSNIVVEMKPYDDCKLSVVKDVVMIYQGTPKLPIKASIATKDGKQKLMKLTSKMKRQNKSLDSLSSRDSVHEKSDMEIVKKKV